MRPGLQVGRTSPGLPEVRNGDTDTIGDTVAQAPGLHATLRELRQVKTEDDQTRERLLRELLAGVTAETVAAVVESLSAEEWDTPFGPVVLKYWLEVDARQAAGWLAARPEATDEQARLLACRLGEDPAGLRSYCNQLPEGEWRQRVLNQAGLERASADPREAIAFAERMKPGPEQRNLIETAAYAWAGRDSETALAWMLRVEDAIVRAQLLEVGAKAIAAADPDLAAAWLDSARAGGGRGEAALAVVELWVAQSPSAAAEWVGRWPADKPRAEAVDLVARRWLQADPGAAGAWLRLLPEGEAVLARLHAAPGQTEDEI